MPNIQFEWDPRKSTSNRRKHGVSFEEASTVFSDEHALLIDDPDHSKEEDRFILLGLRFESPHARSVSLLSRKCRGDTDHLRAEGNQKGA